MAKRTSPIHGPKSSQGLKVQGKSNVGQGHSNGKAWEADDRSLKSPVQKDRGMGSAFATSLLRAEAKRVKAEAKVPGNLGYKQPVDISRITHKDFGPKKGRK